MAIADSILPEFDHEMSVTRSMLVRVPEAGAAWRPHPKSMPLGNLAMHLANLPTWAVETMNSTEFDIHPPESEQQNFTPPTFESVPGLLATFDENVAKARAAIAGASDEEMMTGWTFLNGGVKHFTMPRAAVLRSFVLSHTIHHRAQLGLYLRMNDVPLPETYGPTADSAQ